MFTDAEIGLKLALISMRVSTVRNSSLGESPRILARIRWTDEHDIQIRREGREDRHGLDRILHKTDTVPRVVILVPTIPKEDHLDVGTGNNHLLDLCELGEGVRNGPWVHLVLCRHEIRSAILRIP